MLLFGYIHLSQINGCVNLSPFIYPSRPECSIFQPDTAGKLLQREVHDPDDFSGITTICRREIDLKKKLYRPCSRETVEFFSWELRVLI